MSKKKRVLVAMSGGVDSSVAAALLQEQGYEVIGATMQVWDYSVNENSEICSTNSPVSKNLNQNLNLKKNQNQNQKSQHSEDSGTCCSSLDVDDARAVCDVLNIPFYVINCEKEFKTKVIDKFINSYLQGKTPVPCVDCNTYLKFDYLIKKMKELNCDYLATGHYAQIKKHNGKPKIITSEDSWKDQTYFLFGLDKNILDVLLFPVGDLNKEKTRQYAKDKNLPIYNKKDSTGICFVGKNEYSTFIETQLQKTALQETPPQESQLQKTTLQKTPPKKTPAQKTPAQESQEVFKKQITKGNLLSYPSGKILGTHQGIHKFTYGQRKALGVNSKTPLYVVKINFKTGDVWLGEDKYLYHSIMSVKDFNWLSEVDLTQTLNVKIRFHHSAAEGVLKKEKNQWLFCFKDPQRAITPGQAAVFYQDKQLLGGAWIDKVIEHNSF